METLSASFSAGDLLWMRVGPSVHPAASYDRIKLTLLLGTTLARKRAPGMERWNRRSAGSLSVVSEGTRPEMELSGDGEFVSLLLDPAFFDRPLPERCGWRDPFLSQLLGEAAAKIQRQGTLSPAYVESLAVLAGEHLQSMNPPRDRSRVSLDPLAVEIVTEHVRTHLDEPLHLPELASLVDLSVFHFARAFRDSVGESPHRFVLRQRVEFARALLLAGTSLPEAALQAGFSSQSHFTRCFRESYGRTPGEFMRKERPKPARL